MGAVVVLGMSAAMATASDEDGSPAHRPYVPPNERPGLLDKVFDFGSGPPQKQAPTKEPKKDSVKKAATPAPDKTKTNVSPEAAELAREQAAFQRRQAVCDKLLEIAVANNDKELEQLAEELNTRAWALYTRRTARLQAVASEKGLDEQILDQQLGFDAGPEEAKPAVKPDTRRNKDERSQAAPREEDR
jgi:hypothetical protein